MTRKKALDVADVAELDNEKRVRILGIIDNIRELGVNEDVSLPQVCAHLTLLESTNRVRSLSLLEISQVGSRRSWKDLLDSHFQSLAISVRVSRRKLSSGAHQPTKRK
jgi:hypothetical protein